MSPAKKKYGGIPKRPYGDTGIELSVIGFGGIVAMDERQEHVNRLVAEAVERGINYFDVAPLYGNAEIVLGPALEPYRKDVFLACKTMERTADGARRELKRSLERLRTGWIDLYQLHAVEDVEGDIDTAFGKGGAMEIFLEAKKAGVVRHIGLSAHSEAAALAALDRYDFDSVLFPVNFAAWDAGFGPGIMKRAIEKGAARLALKGLAMHKWSEGDKGRDEFPKEWYAPITNRDFADLALRWTLNQPVTAAIPPGTERMYRWALEIAESLRPLTKLEQAKLRESAAELKPVFPL